MRNKIIQFLENKTREYYRRSSVGLPSDFPLREFAAQLWRGRGYVRHMSFSTRQAVERFLQEKAPRHFYYSSARYDQPGIDDMDAKGWRSADIVFDIDADHLPGCDNRVVKVTNVFGEEASFIAEECISEAAKHALSLYDILVEELGFPRESISIEFSGHRGFHLTVYLRDSDPEARAGQDFRRELVSYVQAVGLQEETLKPWIRLGRKRQLLPVPPLASMAGYRGRVARVAARLADKRLSGVFTSTPVQAARLYAEYREEVDHVLEEASVYAAPVVDAQVTVDTKRLIRAPYSINGKTMLVVRPLRAERLGDFTVSEELSPFAGYGYLRVKVLADTPSAIEVLGHRLRLRQGDRPKLPYPVALYLAAKGIVAPLEESGHG